MNMNKTMYMKPESTVLEFELPMLLGSSVTVKVDDVEDELIDEGETGGAGYALGRRINLFEDEELEE